MIIYSSSSSSSSSSRGAPLYSLKALWPQASKGFLSSMQSLAIPPALTRQSFQTANSSGQESPKIIILGASSSSRGK
eukprot:CAMPEP_0114994278 /NCGR_PEP_ID=MMETSP0216-20121206/13031_1 /TAXON_ID=223996 /ORGANISM="Protocruzia adherens, Strain Boccale" /LENGTH=76 /DNA_ID=CAMNT_0002358083 /DNA_START=704 /DNA_END=934 /DNA_ORIENTATION=-